MSVKFLGAPQCETCEDSPGKVKGKLYLTPPTAKKETQCFVGL